MLGPRQTLLLASSLLVALLVAFKESARAQMLIAPQAAMKTVFPDAQEISRQAVLLTATEKAAVENQAKQKVRDHVLTVFRADKEGRTVGVGVIITAKVRTKDQTALYVINSSGEIKAIEIIAFYEPMEYRPRPAWLALFQGKRDTNSLRLKSDLPVMTGATLTAQAVSNDARTALAIWQVKLKNSLDSSQPRREKPGK